MIKTKNNHPNIITIHYNNRRECILPNKTFDPDNKKCKKT